MSLRCIALDLDGTLLGGTTGRYGFLPAAADVLREAAARGIDIAIVTGRDFPYIVKLLEQEGVVPSSAGWPKIIVSEERCIHEWAADGGFRPDREWNERITALERSFFEPIRAEMTALVRDALSELDPKVRRAEVEEERGFVELIFSDPLLAREGERAVRRRLAAYGWPYEPIRNGAGVSIRHREVGKGAALAKVCEMRGFPRGEVLAMGDSMNDLSMLDGRFGFLAAAPGNADAEVKEVLLRTGGYAASAAFGDGVAEAIRRHL